MLKTCPKCGVTLEVDETEHTPGEVVTKHCPICNTAVQFVIPGEARPTSQNKSSIANDTLKHTGNQFAPHASPVIVQQTVASGTSTTTTSPVHTADAQRTNTNGVTSSSSASKPPTPPRRSFKNLIIGLLCALLIGCGIYIYHLTSSGAGVPGSNVRVERISAADVEAQDDSSDGKTGQAAAKDKKADTGSATASTGKTGKGSKEKTDSEAATETSAHTYVDLGLPSGLRWSVCNLGAISSTDAGKYYAWGEIGSKYEYTPEAYTLQLGSSTLSRANDAAAQTWGAKWHIPTKSEWQELQNNCTWTWTGSGYMVTGKNNRSIFLPAVGYFKGRMNFRNGEQGDYWTATPEGTTESYEMKMTSRYHRLDTDLRHYGASIRPVTY